MTGPEKILNRKSASKAELRQALAHALGVACPEWGKTSVTVHSRCREVFLKAFEKHTGIAYPWQAKDAQCLNRIIKKLYGVAKVEHPGDEDIVHWFDSVIRHLPQWYIDRLSVCKIDGSFPEIIAEISKHGTDKKGNISAQYKQRILDDLCT